MKSGIASLPVVLIASALAACASGASAAGTTANVCFQYLNEAQFSDAHCATAKGGGEGFRHVAFTETTNFNGSNAKTASAAPRLPEAAW